MKISRNQSFFGGGVMLSGTPRNIWPNCGGQILREYVQNDINIIVSDDLQNSQRLARAPQ
jgi:hypothetical protein